ncbi:MAG TPA: hypothetical protein PKC96_00085 [Bacilli bacterium]|nr:hypothetical protein [Bacilli bacterium]
MGKMNLTLARRYLAALKRGQAQKYLNRDDLAKLIGVYSDVVALDLSFFDPLVNMDFDYDLLTLIPSIEIYIAGIVKQKSKSSKKLHIKRDELDRYSSIGEFVFAKMTIGSSGIVNKNVTLSDKDLLLLKKLILREIKNRNKK